MPIQTHVDVDLQSPEVVEFLSSSDTEMTDPDLPIYQSFQLANGFELATTAKPVGTKPIQAAVFETKKYNVYVLTTGGLISSFEVSVAWLYPLNVSIYSEPWVKGSLPPNRKQELVALFDAFDTSSGLDPNQYALENGATPDEYEIVSYFTLAKDPTLPPTADTSAEDAVLQSIAASENYKAEYLQSKWGMEPNNPAPDSIEPGQLPDKIEEIAQSGNCDNFEYYNHRFGTVLTLPEYRAKWRPEIIKIGCISVMVPVLTIEKAEAKYILYAVVVHFSGASDQIMHAIRTCTSDAVKSPTVLAAASTLNLGVAAAAFATLFVDCFYDKAGPILECIIPDLIIEKELGPWGPL